MTDLEYIAGFRSNNESIISSFYQKYKERFIAYFRSHFRKSDEYLTDLYQDSCLVLWQNIRDDKLREDNLTSSLETYLISVGKYSMMARDRKYKEILDDDAISRLRFVESDEEELKSRIEREDYINNLVANMKPPCSELLKAFYWDRLSGQQIANKLGYSNPDSVKTQKHKCMGKLKALIGKYPKE